MADRYARQRCLPQVGEAGQRRLADARMLVVGAGGLGATVLPLLAGAGVGQLHIVDPDSVQEDNLHRQLLYTMADLGHPKAEVAARALRARNPECNVAAHVAWLEPGLAGRLVPEVDVVIDAADRFAVSYALSDQCRQAGVPLISASVLGWEGYVGGFCAAAPSLRALFPALPARAARCASAGVMGPAVAALAAVQAQMALAVLLDSRPSPLGQLLRIDLASWHVSSFRFDEACEMPGPAVIGRDALGPADVVVELRSRQERVQPATPTAIRMTLERVADWRPPPGRRVVFACATGLRAWRAATAVSQRCGNPVAILLAPP